MGIEVGILTLAIGLAVVVMLAMKNRPVALPLMVGFGLRAAAALFDAFVQPLPGADDGIWWHFWAVFNSKRGVFASFELFETGANLYKWLMIFLYALLGPSKLMIQGINVLFGSLIIYNVWKLSILIWEKPSSARRAAWFTALFPGLILFSAVVLREVAVAYPLSLGALYFARWNKERRIRQVICAVAAFLVSMAFHTGILGVLLAGGFWFVGTWLKTIFTGRYRYFLRNTMALVVGLAAVVFVLSSGFGMEKISRMGSPDVGEITRAQDNYSHGRAVYLEDLRAETLPELIRQWPIRLIYFLFTPFPWMVRTTADVFGLIDSALFIWLSYHAFKRRKVLVKNRSALFILAIFLAMALVFSLGVSNYGTAMRHRDKMVPLFIAVVVAWPITRRRRKVTILPRFARVNIRNR